MKDYCPIGARPAVIHLNGYRLNLHFYFDFFPFLNFFFRPESSIRIREMKERKKWISNKLFSKCLNGYQICISPWTRIEMV